MKDKDIELLLGKLDEAETDDEIREIGEKILEIDSKSPYGKLAVWETMGYEDSLQNLSMLKDALEEIRNIVDSNDAITEIDEDRDAQVYCTVMMNLGYCLFVNGDLKEALPIAKELVNFDDEDYYRSRTLLYRILLDLEMYDEILEALDADPNESVVGEHARAIVLLERKASKVEVFDAITYAISLSPDAPFFALGIWDWPEEDEEIDEDTEEVVNYATYISEPWSETDLRLSAVSAPVFLFGYLTGRLDDAEGIASLESAYGQTGVLKEIHDAKKNIDDMEKDSDSDEIDATALDYTREILEKIIEG